MNSKTIFSIAELDSCARKAAAEAVRGSGCSDVLYEATIQAAYRSMLEDVADDYDLRVEAEAFLLECGFNPDYTPYEAKEGECSLTGIEENCCPCGRHP